MVTNCECLECQKAAHYAKYYATDNLEGDNLEGKPDDFLGAKLVALKDVPVYTSPNGTLIKVVKTGDNVGVIYSYVIRDGIVWWQVDGSNTGFVKHEKGSFDDIAITNSLRENKAKKEAAIKEAADKRIAENENPLYNFLPDLGGYVKWIFIGLAVIVATVIFLRLTK